MFDKDIYVLLPFRPNKDNYVQFEDIETGFAIEKGGNVYEYLAKAYLKHLKDPIKYKKLAKFFIEMNRGISISKNINGFNWYVNDLNDEEKAKVYLKNSKALKKDKIGYEIIAGMMENHEFGVFVIEKLNIHNLE